MALAETANLIVNLGLKGNFARDIGKANRSLDQLVKGESRAFKAGAQIGTGIRNGARLAAIGVGILTTQVVAGLGQLATLEKATAQTNAVLKSTKGVAGQTADSVRALAEEYENLNATIDDKVIQSGENLLLTFTNIRKKAFEPALLAALNINTRLGGGEGGLQNTIKLVGKALNDPIKGLGALSRAGITFSAAQTKQIKTLVKNNDLLGAQDLILKELGKRYGGAFAAEGKTAEAAIKGIGDAVEDLQKALATALFPAVQKVLPRIREVLSSPEFLKGATDLGEKIAGLFSDENLKTGADVLKGLFQTAKDAAPAIASAAKITGQVVSTAVKMFTSLPKELQTLLIGGLAVNKLTGGLVTNIAGGLISSVLKQLVSGVVNVQGGVVNVSGAGIGGAAGAGAVGGGNKLLALGIAGAIIAAAVPIGEAFASALPDSWKGGGDHPGESESQRRIREGKAAMAAKGGVVPVRVINDRALDGGAQRLTNQILSQRWRIARSARDTLRSEHIKGAAAPSLKLDKVPAKLDKVSEAVSLARDASKEAGVNTISAVTDASRAIDRTTATTSSTSRLTQSAVRGVAPPIVGAIRANRPIVSTSVVVNVSANSVTKSVTYQNRYGPGTGSNAAPNTRSGPAPI